MTAATAPVSRRSRLVRVRWARSARSARSLSRPSRDRRRPGLRRGRRREGGLPAGRGADRCPGLSREPARRRRRPRLSLAHRARRPGVLPVRDDPCREPRLDVPRGADEGGDRGERHGRARARCPRSGHHRASPRRRQGAPGRRLACRARRAPGPAHGRGVHGPGDVARLHARVPGRHPRHHGRPPRRRRPGVRDRRRPRDRRPRPREERRFAGDARIAGRTMRAPTAERTVELVRGGLDELDSGRARPLLVRLSRPGARAISRPSTTTSTGAAACAATPTARR